MTTLVASATLPFMTTATANPYETAGRAKNVLRLTMSIDAALDAWGIDPFSAQALEIVLAMDEKIWAQACKSAGIEAASETTRGQVVEVYTQRVETRNALAYLRKPVLTVVR